MTDLTPDTDRTERNAIDFHERNSRFLNTSQIFKLFSNHFSIICKNVTEAKSPFSPISSLPEVGHLDMETVTTNSQQWMVSAPITCLDKTQIRGYSTDTAANNESYLHTPVMAWRDIVTMWPLEWFVTIVWWQCLSVIILSQHSDSQCGDCEAQTWPITDSNNHSMKSLFVSYYWVSIE